jgi:hypothetical protein
MRRRSTPASRQITLPASPRTASPVPWLTSIHAVRNRGPWGSSSYRGNCGGYLIKDLIQFFGATNVLDPMTGSGTCGEVCRDLGVSCTSFDIRAGQDASDPASYAGLAEYDLVWLHPPYWRMVRYSDDPRCLSKAPTLEAFMDQLGAVMRNGASVLAPGGHLAVLIGGYHDREDGNRHIPLAALATARAIEEGLWPACTDIVRFQHGNTSSQRSYRSSFIPGLHDTCIVLKPTG